MSEIKINGSVYDEDFLIVNSTCENIIYLSAGQMGGVEVSVGLGLEGVNKLQQMIDDWKEINGYD